MTIRELDNLVRVGQLRYEPCAQSEFDGLIRAGRTGISDARNEALAPQSRFALGYNAAHAFALAALRWHGYRSQNRYVVFQAVPHTLGLDPQITRLLSKAHELLNLAEYEGHFDVDRQFLADFLSVAAQLAGKVVELGTPPESLSDDH
jgi:hypothetical protein